jgi:glycosyltransferase involved in cell wall biosynthesis
MSRQQTITVLYIVTKLELGGAQKVCLSLFEGLRALQHTTLLISGTEGVLHASVDGKEGVYLIPEFKREVSVRGMVNELYAFYKLWKTIRLLKKRYPHLVVHTHSTKAGLVGRWSALFAGVKKRIHTVHGFGFHPYQNKLAWFVHYSLELITSFITTTYICVSSADMQTGSRLIPWFKRKATIIRAAVDDQRFSAARPIEKIPSENDLFIIGTVSCFKQQKNLTDLILAFVQAYSINPLVRLEIIGDGIMRPDLEQLIQEQQIDDVVTLLGWQEDVASHMSRWHLFALSSLWEGLPCAIVEARLMKLPVVCYNVGGISDIIVDRKNGFLIPSGDYTALAQKIVVLSKDEQLYKSMQNNSHDQLDSFKLHAMIQEHTKIY